RILAQIKFKNNVNKKVSNDTFLSARNMIAKIELDQRILAQIKFKNNVNKKVSNDTFLSARSIFCD
ncbi:hypothetical protein AB7W24_06115, partial [Providencia rettgeri]